MNFKEINYGKAALRVLVLLIVKPLSLPLRIYYNALTNLSSASDESSDENKLASDFPLYVWITSLYDAIIALAYPIGIIVAIIASTNKYTGGFGTFVGAIVATYFLPLCIGIMRELLLFSLKIVLYLKIIAGR